MLKRICDRCGADIQKNKGEVLSFDMKRYDLCSRCVKPFKAFMGIKDTEEDSAAMFKAALDKAFYSSPDFTCEKCGKEMNKGYAVRVEGKIKKICSTCYAALGK